LTTVRLFRYCIHATLTSADARRNHRLAGFERVIRPDSGLQPVSAPPICCLTLDPGPSDYPSFYTRLYAFLDRDLLHNKHRARFFRLTELFLSSTWVSLLRDSLASLTFGCSHLPAALLASFIKRLSRLSISAPPAGIIMVIPFTYNILKRHPALMYMINRVDDVEEPGMFRTTLPAGGLNSARLQIPSIPKRRTQCSRMRSIHRSGSWCRTSTTTIIPCRRWQRFSRRRLENPTLLWRTSWTIHTERWVVAIRAFRPFHLLRLPLVVRKRSRAED